jgi:hypothetical protein
LETLDNPHHALRVAFEGHEIDDSDTPRFSCEVGLKDQRVTAIGLPRRATLITRANPPMAVFFRSEQSRKTGSGVESGKTKPIDRSSKIDQGSGVSVTDETVILQFHSRRTTTR